jgi:hypothetical protein
MEIPFWERQRGTSGTGAAACHRAKYTVEKEYMYCSTSLKQAIQYSWKLKQLTLGYLLLQVGYSGIQKWVAKKPWHPGHYDD